MRTAAHRRFMLVGVLLAAGGCESASTPHAKAPEPTNPAKAPEPPKPVHEASRPKPPAPIVFDAPVDVENNPRRLQYQSGALYWIADQGMISKTRDIVRFDLQTLKHTVVSTGDSVAHVPNSDDLVVEDKGQILLVTGDDAPRKVLAEGQDNPSYLHVDETHAYWKISDTQHVRIGANHIGSIRRVALSGGAVEELARDTGNGPMTLHQGQLYWNHRGIQTMPAAGGTVRSVEPARSESESMPGTYALTTSLRAGDGSLYLARNGAALAISLDSGASQVLSEQTHVVDVRPLENGKTLLLRQEATQSRSLHAPLWKKAEFVILHDDQETVVPNFRSMGSTYALGAGVVYYINAPIGSPTPATLHSKSLMPSP